MQIISRTVSILEEVARRADGGGLVEIANTTSLPAATCHRLLAALAEDELVHRDPLTRRYSVGRGVVQLAGGVSPDGRGAPPLQRRAGAGAAGGDGHPDRPRRLDRSGDDGAPRPLAGVLLPRLDR